MSKCESPLIIGLEVRGYSTTTNIADKKRIIIKRPSDAKEWKFFTYAKKGDNNNKRLRLELIPHVKATFRTMMGSTQCERINIIFIKKIRKVNTH